MNDRAHILLCLMFFLSTIQGYHHGQTPTSELNTANDLPARTYAVWDDKPAPNGGSDYEAKTRGRAYPYDRDWEQHSYPLGNGYMGINVFGRLDTERIQLTEKTLFNAGLYGSGGLTNFAEIYLEFDQDGTRARNYRRELQLNTAIKHVAYDYEDVQYKREYFVNYPDNVAVVRLEADRPGHISLTLAPQIPYLNPLNQENLRTGQVTAEGDTITLSGTVDHFSVNYEAQVKVIHEGGSLQTLEKDGNGAIRVDNADHVTLLIVADTNYRLRPEIFFESDHSKKLDADEYPSAVVNQRMKSATEKGFAQLRSDHIADYGNLFGRVGLQLSEDVPAIKTDELIEAFRDGEHRGYLQELVFHFGRYLLISSSRPGTLPSGLQGTWSQYEVTPWTGGFWHNINIQMNYWGAFNTNLHETFVPYMEYFTAYLPKARELSTSYLQRHNPEVTDGDNGWTIGTGVTPYIIKEPGGHSGPGTGGLTVKMFWDYYDFTRDPLMLEQTVYPAIKGMSNHLSKTLVEEDDGTLLVGFSLSPEQRVDNEYYVSKGVTFDQSMIWETYRDFLEAGRVLGKTSPLLDQISDEIGRLDPILIGSSGQLKEYREEDAYGEIGQYRHRHISHLCALYPGTLIGPDQPEWQTAAAYSLTERGNETTGWGLAHRMCSWARLDRGDEALVAYDKYLAERTVANLWGLHPPFQIDGNLGVMAGVAEMLVQSHHGVVRVLPALPEDWADGQFSGLVARGNFLVDATWKQHQLQTLNVHARVGGDLKIESPGLASACVVNAAGDPVNTESLTADRVRIVTTQGDRLEFVFEQSP